jgi:hypothetical protein
MNVIIHKKKTIFYTLGKQMLWTSIEYNQIQ